jgi:hypothetical protein
MEMRAVSSRAVHLFKHDVFITGKDIDWPFFISLRVCCISQFRSANVLKMCRGLRRSAHASLWPAECLIFIGLARCLAISLFIAYSSKLRLPRICAPSLLLMLEVSLS